MNSAGEWSAAEVAVAAAGSADERVEEVGEAAAGGCADERAEEVEEAAEGSSAGQAMAA